MQTTTTDGQRLKAARNAAGLSRLKLAATLGVSEVTVWRWETDRVEPPFYARASIVIPLGVPVADIWPE